MSLINLRKWWGLTRLRGSGFRSSIAISTRFPEEKLARMPRNVPPFVPQKRQFSHKKEGPIPPHRNELFRTVPEHSHPEVAAPDHYLQITSPMGKNSPHMLCDGEKFFTSPRSFPLSHREKLPACTGLWGSAVHSGNRCNSSENRHVKLLYVMFWQCSG